MSADLRLDIKPGDVVGLIHEDGTKLAGKLTGTDRWITPGGIPFESLDTLIKHGFVVAWVNHTGEPGDIDTDVVLSIDPATSDGDLTIHPIRNS